MRTVISCTECSELIEFVPDDSIRTELTPFSAFKNHMLMNHLEIVNSKWKSCSYGCVDAIFPTEYKLNQHVKLAHLPQTCDICENLEFEDQKDEKNETIVTKHNAYIAHVSSKHPEAFSKLFTLCQFCSS